MRTFDVDPSSTGQLCRYRLLVEPDVLHAPAVGNAVDHDRQSFYIGLPAAATSIVKDDRASTVLGQLPFDFPNQSSARLLIGLCRLLIDQLVDLRIAVAIVVQVSAAPVEQVKVLVGVGPASRQVETDGVILAHDLGEPDGAVDRIEFAVDVDL